MHKIAIYSLKLSIAIFVCSLFSFVLFSDLVFADIVPTQASYTGNDEVILNYDCFFEVDNPSNLNLYISGPTGIELRGCEITGNVSYSLGIANQLSAGNYQAIMIPNNNTCNGFSECFDAYPIPYASFNIVEILPPQNIYGAGGLLGTSTNLLASVGTGVVDTGANIWPLFVFLGVILAFVIAGYVRDFIIQAGADSRKRAKYHTDLANAPNQQKIMDIIDDYNKKGD